MDTFRKTTGEKGNRDENVNQRIFHFSEIVVKKSPKGKLEYSIKNKSD